MLFNSKKKTDMQRYQQRTETTAEKSALLSKVAKLSVSDTDI